MSFDELSSILKSIDKKLRDDWELMRIQTFHLMLPHVGKENIKSFTPQKLIPLPWDNQDRSIPTTSENKKEILKRMSVAKSTGKVAKL